MVGKDDKQQQGSGGSHGPRGPIRLDEVYTLDELKWRLGWKDAALRAARGRGLVVLRSGKCGFVHGQEVLDFLKRTNSAV